MFSRFCLILLCIMHFAVCVHAAGPKDPRFALILQGELQTKINQTPINSAQQILLISRARNSHLSDFAYRQYTQIWQKNPGNPYANLLAGMAAENDWEYQTSPTTNLLKPYSPEARSLSGSAKRLLGHAVQMMPNSPRANMEYGYFLWHIGNAADLGFPLLLKAVKLAPGDPVANVLLGEAYMNPSLKYYNQTLAEASIKKAIASDPLYAYPHLSLVFLYNDTKRYKEAQAQLEEYLNLTPPDVSEDKIVQILQSAINKGLRKS